MNEWDSGYEEGFEEGLDIGYEDGVVSTKEDILQYISTLNEAGFRDSDILLKVVAFCEDVSDKELS